MVVQYLKGNTDQVLLEACHVSSVDSGAHLCNDGSSSTDRQLFVGQQVRLKFLMQLPVENAQEDGAVVQHCSGRAQVFGFVFSSFPPTKD